MRTANEGARNVSDGNRAPGSRLQPAEETLLMYRAQLVTELRDVERQLEALRSHG